MSKKNKDLIGDTKGDVTIFESPMKLEKLIFSKKDGFWRAKIITNRVDNIHDQTKCSITLNLLPFEETIERIGRQIEDAKAQPDLFDGGHIKDLKAEQKEEETAMEEARKKFGKIQFTAMIENLAQKDNNRTAMTIFVPTDNIPDFMAKINKEADFISKIEFYI